MAFNKREGDFKREKPNFIYGIHSIIEAIEAGREIDKILIQNGLGGDLIAGLKRKLKDNDIVYNGVPIDTLNRITRSNHQGAVAYISEINYFNVEDILPQLFEEGEIPFFLILDRITDVRNFGAICRTAYSAGIHAIIVPFKGGAPANADAVKTSAGALSKIKVCRSPNLKYTINFLKESGVQIIACTEKSEKNYTSMDFTKPTAIIMGSEEDGVSLEYLRLCDSRAMIPMIGNLGSLNVSVATGIILYEVIRQRLQ
jgi:23S rRNA (guanosine2251-2'-O)-methyltransferase